MSELMDQALLLQLRQRPRESASSRLAQYLLQQAGRPGPVYGTLGVLATAAQPMLAAWLAKRGEEREREAEREAFNQILNLERQRAQEAAAFWRGVIPQQSPATQPTPEMQQPPMPQQPTVTREPLPPPAEASQGNWLDRLAQAESSGNPNAVNQFTGRATGLFQFLPDTWLDFARANPARFANMTNEQILAARTDPALSREAAEWYARRNALILGTARLPATPANLALAHRFGGAGAIALLRAEPNALATDVLPDGQSVLEANPDLRGRTVGQVIESYRQLVGEPQAQAQAQALPAMPAAAGMPSEPMPQTMPATPGMVPGIIQPRQIPETIPGLPQGVTPEMMAQALAHPNPMIRQQAAAFLQAAQAFQRQTPNLTSVTPGNFLIDPRTGQVIGQVPQMPGEAERFLMQFIELERQRGTPPEELMRKISSVLERRLEGGRVNVDARQMGSIPPGYRVEYDEQGRPIQMAPIPGGPAERELREAEERRRLREEQQRQQAENMLRNINNAINIIDTTPWPVAGFGSNWLLRMNSEAAIDLRETLKTIRANIGFNQLNSMRQASPTGGALGNVTERELEFLQAVWGSLEQSQSPKQLKDNLLYIRKQIQRVVTQGMTEDEIDKEMERLRARQRQSSQSNAVPPPPDGAERVTAPSRGR